MANRLFLAPEAAAAAVVATTITAEIGKKAPNNEHIRSIELRLLAVIHHKPSVSVRVPIILYTPASTIRIHAQLRATVM